MKRRVLDLHTLRGLALTGMVAGLGLACGLLGWELWSEPFQRPVGAASASPEPGTLSGLDGAALAELRARNLSFPVEGVAREGLLDSFREPRGAGDRRHGAVDIMAPRRTPVRAVEDGTVARLDRSPAGGISIYLFDASERYCYYYAHLDAYAPGLQEGTEVERGQLLGYVGTSGNAPRHAPHLHFAIFRLWEAKQWWAGTALNPYAVLR